MLWDVATLAYYRFNSGSLSDSFRNNVATFIYSEGYTTSPSSLSDDAATDLCFAFTDLELLGLISSSNAELASV